jgi:hypothetical protein
MSQPRPRTASIRRRQSIPGPPGGLPRPERRHRGDVVLAEVELAVPLIEAEGALVRVVVLGHGISSEMIVTDASVAP